MVKFWLKSYLIILGQGFLILVFLDVVIGNAPLFMREYALYIKMKKINHEWNHWLNHFYKKKMSLTLNNVTVKPFL